MTRERFARNEAVALDGNALVVLDTVGQLNQLGQLSDAGLRQCRDFERRAFKAGVPFKTGTEVEVIPGPAPRHRVGCENIRSEWVPPKYPLDHSDGALRRWMDRRAPPPQWKLGDLAHWGKGYRNPHMARAKGLVESRSPVVIEQTPYGPRFVLEPVPVLVSRWKGSLSKPAQPEDLQRAVLGPHSTWLWINTPLFGRGSGPGNNEQMLRQLRALRNWAMTEDACARGLRAIVCEQRRAGSPGPLTTRLGILVKKPKPRPNML